MSRLYDRVLAYGCRAFRPSDLELRPRAEVLAGRRALIEQQDPELSEAAVERVLENFWAHEPQAVERLTRLSSTARPSSRLTRSRRTAASSRARLTWLTS